MGNFSNYVFVLWADEFEETAATIFVTVLREAGLRVKLVGLSRQQISGAHGLALVPDLTLEQALPLAGQSCGVIIPGALGVARRLENDPRLDQFFAEARANQAQMVLGPVNGTGLDDLSLFSLGREEVTVYPGLEDLLAFARRMAGSLLSSFG